MHRACWTLTAIVLPLLLALPLQAAVYRWVDDDGLVQYADHPPTGVDAELIDPDAGIADEVEDPEPTLETSAEDEDGDADDDDTPRTLDEYCDKVRTQLETLDSSEEVGMTNDEGELQRLSEEERAEHRGALQEQLDQNC